MVCRITKVKDFQKLAVRSEADGHLQQKLKQLLKLSKEKWDAACDHSKIAVQVEALASAPRTGSRGAPAQLCALPCSLVASPANTRQRSARLPMRAHEGSMCHAGLRADTLPVLQADNRMRAWWEPGMRTGLLYGCTHGDIKPDCPCALIKRDGVQDRVDVIPNDSQVPDERNHVRLRLPPAEHPPLPEHLLAAASRPRCTGAGPARQARRTLTSANRPRCLGSEAAGQAAPSAASAAGCPQCAEDVLRPAPWPAAAPASRRQTPALRAQVQRICQQAAEAWWQDSHQGWMIFAINGRFFHSLDEIIAFSQVCRLVGPQEWQSWLAGEHCRQQPQPVQQLQPAVLAVQARDAHRPRLCTQAPWRPPAAQV